MKHRSPLFQKESSLDDLSLFLWDLELPSESVDSALGIVHVRLGGNQKSVLSLPGLTDNTSQDVRKLVDNLA
jgi:hypothetical protein